MATDLTYKQLRREVRDLAREIKQAADVHQRTASAQADEAKDTARIADQLATLGVDQATIAETREVSRVMQGLSTAAVGYASAADTAHRAAGAAEQQAQADHGGIQDAVDRSTTPMANASFYTQE